MLYGQKIFHRDTDAGFFKIHLICNINGTNISQSMI